MGGGLGWNLLKVVRSIRALVLGIEYIRTADNEQMVRQASPYSPHSHYENNDSLTSSSSTYLPRPSSRTRRISIVARPTGIPAAVVLFLLIRLASSAHDRCPRLGLLLCVVTCLTASGVVAVVSIDVVEVPAGVIPDCFFAHFDTVGIGGLT
jgi:hypothetical protein